MYKRFEQEVPKYIMEDLRERMWVDSDDESKDEEILSLSGADFLDAWLGYQGIIGYTDSIIEVINIAFGIDLNNAPFDETIKRIKEEY